MKNRDLEIEVSCPYCGENYIVVVNAEDYFTWCEGALVQDAFPYLTASERELLISGICPSCWDKMFGGDLEEEDDDEIDLECGFNPYLGCFDFDC